MVTSDVYPDVSFRFQYVGGTKDNLRDLGAEKVLSRLDDVPEQDLIGIKKVDFLTPKLFKSAYISDKSMYMGAESDDSPIMIINNKSEKSAREDMIHETGHHLERDMLEGMFKKGVDPMVINIIEDRTADYYSGTITGKNTKRDASDWQKDEIDFQKALVKKKAITFDEAEEYTNKFSDEDDEVVLESIKLPERDKSPKKYTLIDDYEEVLGEFDTVKEAKEDLRDRYSEPVIDTFKDGDDRYLFTSSTIGGEGFLLKRNKKNEG